MMRHSTVFYFLVCVTVAAALYVPSTTNTNTLHKKDATWPNVGNYHFVNCGDDITQSLTKVLTTLLDALNPALKDAQTSHSHPTGAYEIFFKGPQNAAFVATVIQNITTGPAMYPPGAHTTGSPTFICPKKGDMNVRSPDGRVGDAYTQCIESSTAARYLGPTPGSSSAPSSSPNRPSPRAIAARPVWQNQMWIFFHEMVHYYLYAQPGYVNFLPEVYNINHAWALSAKDSLRNSENFVFYAATVYANCTDWPVLLRDNERELMAADRDDADVLDEESDAVAGDAVEVSEAEFDDSPGQVNF
ncbi:MAG: hypothetical protein LQ339_008945 [Xanthoria mediterranea]|nr:MAG: hypothetical protein LQ339_008945 [Xanthoria mediterranea]